METKRLTMLILGGMITAANGEDFINTQRELGSFSSQYDFGTPIGQQESVSEAQPEAIQAEDANATPDETPVAKKSTPRQELRKELNITCGAKCGISFKTDANDS